MKNAGFWIFRVSTYTINGKVEGRKWKVKESFKTNPEAYQLFKKARKNELISTGLTTLILGKLCYDLFSKNKEYKDSPLATGVSVVSLGVAITSIALGVKAWKLHRKATDVYNHKGDIGLKKEIPTLHLCAVNNGIGLGLSF